MTDKLDEKIIAYALKSKKFTMELTNVVSPSYFKSEFQPIYKAIESHFTEPKFKEIPTESVFEDFVRTNYDNEDFIQNSLSLFRKIKDVPTDDSEFTWYLNKLKVRYNDQVQRSCTSKVVQLIKTEADPNNRIEEVNKLMREAVVNIDAIYKQQAYREGALSESAKSRALRYKEIEENPDIARGILTGFNEFDRITNGLHKGELMIVAGATGCQPAGSKVLMADGNWKNVEDVVIGDKVLSPQHDGSVDVNVVIDAMTFSDIDIYRVQTKDKHKLSYLASHNHILPIISASSIKKDKSKNKLVEMSIDEFNEQSDNWKKHARLFTSPAYDLPEQDLPLPPYFVGVMLGDGSLTDYPSLVSADKKIFDKLESLGIFMGKLQKDKRSKAMSRNITKNSRVLVNNLFGTDLRSYNKFIPDIYMRGSLQQRLELLAGLLDTDGTFEEFSSTSCRLAEDFKKLVFSVGGRASIKERNTRYERKGKFFKSYRVHYSFSEHMPPVILRRKKRKARNMQWKNPRNRGFEVFYEGKDIVYGFTLDGKSQWYITDNHIVTHNTGKSVVMHNIAVNAYLNGNNPLRPASESTKEGYNILYFSLEMPKESMERRIDSCMAGIYYNEIRDGSLSVEDKKKYYDVLKFQSQYDKYFHIVDMAKGATPREIELKFLEVSATKGKPDLVVIDYLGVMSPNETGESDWLSLGKIAADLHEFARVYEIPTVTGSQVNRPKEGKPSHGTDRIARSDTITHNANIIIQIDCRENEYTRTDMPIFITKMRDGEKGAFTLSKDFKKMKVIDMVAETFGEDELDEYGV